MKKIERNLHISFWWARYDGKNIRPKHVEALEETAMDRISETMKEGYTSGQLSDSIHMDSRDGADGQDYRGWWELKSDTAT